VLALIKVRSRTVKTQLVKVVQIDLLKRRHVSAYLEAIFRFTKCRLIETNVGTVVGCWDLTIRTVQWRIQITCVQKLQISIWLTSIFWFDCDLCFCFSFFGFYTQLYICTFVRTCYLYPPLYCVDDEISTSNHTVPTLVSMSQHFVNLKMASRQAETCRCFNKSIYTIFTSCVWLPYSLL
jgi:hypothetical protein